MTADHLALGVGPLGLALGDLDVDGDARAGALRRQAPLEAEVRDQA